MPLRHIIPSCSFPRPSGTGRIGLTSSTLPRGWLHVASASSTSSRWAFGGLEFNRSDVGRIWRRIKRGVGPIREVQKNVWVLPPLTIPPAHHLRWAEHINTWQLRTRIASWLRAVDAGRPIVWTYHPYVLRLATVLDPTALIYHCVDNIGAVPGVDGIAFDHAERKLLATADRDLHH